jgi:hypothetical protein
LPIITTLTCDLLKEVWISHGLHGLRGLKSVK